MTASLHSIASPQSEAERNVLGALLQDNAILWRLGDLAPDDFLDVELRLLWETLAITIREGELADPVTIAEGTGRRWSYEQLGQLVRECVAPANAARYAEIVRRGARQRRQRLALQQALVQLDAGEERWWEECVVAIQRAHHARRLYSHDDLVDAAQAARVERERLKAAGREFGLRSGIPTLDGTLDGIYGSRLYILGGRPGSYKSAFAWQIAAHAACSGRPAGYISLEMDEEELGDRVLRRAGDREVPRGIPIHVDRDSRTLDEILWSALELRERHRVEIVVVDHVQLIRHVGRGMSRFDALCEISGRLKGLAMRLGVPVLALSQLSREVEKDNRAPRLSDLRESGNLEQDADVVMFLWREEERRKGPGIDKHWLLLEKNRRGVARIRAIPLIVDGRTMHIRETVDR